MSKFIDIKKQSIDVLANDFKNYKSFLIFEFTTLNCENFEILRKKLHKLNSKILIKKNNILNRFFLKLKILNSINLKGQNAILFFENTTDPVQEIVQISKKNKKIKLKFAYFENQIIDESLMKEFVSIKNKDHILEKLAQTLLIPLYKLSFIIKNIKND